MAFVLRSDPARTARRVAALDAYFRRAVLDGEAFRCQHRTACRRSHPGILLEGQLHHVGAQFDLFLNDVPCRIVVVGQEYGHDPAHVSLRERSDDIPLLVDHFLAKHAERLGRPRPSVDKAVYSAFNLYAWPGNIRDLENVIERVLVLDRDGLLGLDDLTDRLKASGQRIGNLRIALPDDGISLEDVERELPLAALEKHNWNQTRAAAHLNITRSTLRYRMQKFGLERARP
jgi:hypothetical protein